MEIGPTSLWLPPTGIGAAGENWQAVFASGQYRGGSLYSSLARLKEGGPVAEPVGWSLHTWPYFGSTSVASSSAATSLVREPDAGNLHVQVIGPDDAS